MATLSAGAAAAARTSWAWLVKYGPVLLVASETIRLLALLLPNGFNFVDLRVYTDGAARLGRGDLYDFTHVTGDGPLPFTYPPFAAVVLYPWHFLPFPVAAVSWQLLSLAALYLSIRICFQLLRPAGPPPWRLVAVCTVLAMWTEPVRVTLSLGQVNLFLLLAALAAIRSRSWVVSGLLIGTAAGIKLTPAIGGLYFVARRRWGAAAMSAAAFAATVALAYAIDPRQTWRYFTVLLGDANRIGPVGSVWNQSLRGTLSRFAGYDIATGWPWLAACALTAMLAFLAWRALPGGDLLGTMLVMQLLGLMVSPISWLHHFVWLIPLVLWFSCGPVRDRAGARVLASCWAVALAAGPWALGGLEPSLWVIPRPLPVAILHAIYAAGVWATFCWIIATGRPQSGGVILRGGAPALPASARGRGLPADTGSQA